MTDSAFRNLLAALMRPVVGGVTPAMAAPIPAARGPAPL